MSAVCLIEVLKAASLLKVSWHPYSVRIEIVLLNEWMNWKLIYNVPSHLSLDLLVLLDSWFGPLSLGGGYLFINQSLIIFKILLQTTSSSSLRDHFMLHNLFCIAIVE